MTFPPIAHDEIWPRDDEHRFRLYGLADGVQTVLAAAPTLEAIGTAIGQLHADMKEGGLRLADLGAIGILDAVEREWIVNPYPRTL